MSFLYSSLEGPFNMDTMILKYCYNFKLVFQNDGSSLLSN